MTPLVDPLLNRFVAYSKVDFARTFSNSLDRLTPPLDFLGREFSGRLHQFCHRLAVPRDRDFAALLDLVEQAGQMGLGFEDADVFHGNKTSLTRLVCQVCGLSRPRRPSLKGLAAARRTDELAGQCAGMLAALEDRLPRDNR